MRDFSITSENIDSMVKDFYNDYLRVNSERIKSQVDAHKKHFGREPDRLFSSPGRVELLGNHTDHNGGLAFSSTIDLDTLATVNATDDGIITVHSEGYRPIVVHLNDLSLKKKEIGTSTAMLKGVLKYYVDHGKSIGAFQATVTSKVISGSGVSSSASFEVLIAEIENVLYNDGNVTSIEKAIASQYAENEYFGKPSGLLDQATIAIGGLIKLDFFEPIPQYDRITASGDFKILLVNTGDHSNLTSDYADIKKEMQQVAAFFGETRLIDIDAYEFRRRSIEVAEAVKNGRSILRAVHFFEENERVRDAFCHTRAGDYQRLFQRMNESGVSSQAQLQNCFVAGDIEQPIPLCAKLLKMQHGVHAARVHGGGFAGTVIALVRRKYIRDVKAAISRVYGEENVFITDFRPIGTTEIPYIKESK